MLDDGRSTALAIIETQLPGLPIEEVVERAKEYGRNAISEATRRIYETDWADFAGWCRSRGLVPMPAEPQTVGIFLAERAETHKVSTLQRRLAAISRTHRTAGHRLDTRHPAISDVFAGIRRAKGTAPSKKTAIMPAGLRAMLSALPEGLAGKRDRAVLLLGFAGAFRRSELVALDAPDLEFSAQGLAVKIRRSKTDQEGAGHVLGIQFGEFAETCPVRAVDEWLQASGLASLPAEEAGAVFRSVRHGRVGGRLSDKDVARIVKRAAKAAGMDPAQFAGHSLRSGFATSAAANGADLIPIMQQTRHKSERVARGYVQRGSIFRNKAVAVLGL